MSADTKRGQELAELAREFLLWLRDNEVPGIPGLRGLDADAFAMYAGIYRKAVDMSRYGNVTPLLWADEPRELSRLQDLNLGVTHVLLVSDPQDTVLLPDGRTGVNNRIMLADRRPLEQAGALMTVKPTLDSLRADPDTISRMDYLTLCAILQRTDLVYDDVETARAARFQYPQLLDYQPPRVAYDAHVHDIPVPEEVVTSGGRPLPPPVALERIRQYREYMYQTATYRNRKLVAEKGGKYYSKWRAKNPLTRDKRQFVPSKLSDEFLRTNFLEHVMKQGDNLLLIDLATSRHIFRLLRDEKRNGKLIVQQLLTIGQLTWAPDGKGQFKPEVKRPVTAVFFHALEGGKNLPTLFRFGNLDYRGSLPARYTYHYKAALRWYYNDQRLTFDNDAAWLDKFVSVFFGDQSYILEPSVLPAQAPDREWLFLAALKQSAAEAPAGPVKDRLTELVKWCTENMHRYVFTQGMRLGPDDNPRELIGITGAGNVFEWHPKTGLVTIMKFTDWLNEIRIEDLSADIYRNTAGLLPFITLVTWGGVVVMTGGVLGVQFSLGSVARTTITQLVTKAAGSRIAKKAAKEARPFLTATLVAAAMDLVPKSDTLVYHFIKGFFQGFGGGAVEHYLSEFDERLERTVKKAPAMVANYVTKNGYTAYVIYDKVRAAIIRITGVVQGLRTALTDKRAQLIAKQLGEFSQYVGMAFVVILFVVVYLDWVHRSRPKVKADEWIRKQQQSLKWMIESTGQEVLVYSHKVRAELANLKGDHTSPEAADIVRKHDQTLRASIGKVLNQGITAAPAVAEFLQNMMQDMGIDDWDDLQRLGFMEVLSRGVGALPTKGLANDQVERLGKAVGELVGTIMLERAVVPKSAERDTGLLFDKRQTARATKTALAGGTWRSIWRFAIHPFANLRNLPAGLAKSLSGITDPDKADGHTFSHLTRRDTAYRDFIASLVADEQELAHRLANLASDVGLEKKLTDMVNSVAAGKSPPVLNDLLGKDNPDWPTEAILFLLYSWMRFGLHQLLEAFALIDDSKPYGGAFKLSDLLDILGLDLALDDTTLKRLMTTFSRHAGTP